MATQTLTTPSGIWQELGVTSGMDLPPAHRLKCYVMSLPGMGKTWFGASIPDALHIDFEDQAKFVPAPRANRVVITSGKQLDELVEKLIDTAADNPWNHVIWDTIEHSLGVIIPYLTDELNEKSSKQYDDIREYGGKGAGWDKVNSYTLALLRRLYNVGYGWTVLGHYKEVDITDPGSRDTVTVLRPLINEGIKGGITRDAQYVMRIRQEVTKEQVMKKTKGGMEIPDTRSVFSVKLALTSPMSKDTMTMLVKDRLGQFLPEEVDITGDDGFGVWKGAYDAACVEAEKVTG